MDGSLIISVIVPVYNTEERYLRRCLRPFIEHYDKRIELIVVDDGSEESSSKVIQALASNVRVSYRLVRQNNRGQNAARNAGINHASGRYICFLDSDDSINWDEFLKLLEYAEYHRVDCITFNAKELSPNGAIVGGRDFSTLLRKSNDEIKRNLLCRCQELWTHLLSRDLLTTSHGLYENATIGEDLVSLFAIMSEANTFAVLNCSPYQYWQRETSMMHMASVAQRFTIIDAFDHLLHFIDAQIIKTYHDELEWQAIYHVRYIEAGNMVKSSLSNIRSAASMQRWVDCKFPNWRGNCYLVSDFRAGSSSFKLISGGHLRLFGLLYQLKRILKTRRRL